ncbi:McrC family protein [Actinomycetospora corticicola]|uniref:McrC family protein n=1 Tax=Actinomycetospora corticicola TaxID=663602 RepID=UPI001C54923D
MKCSEGLRVQQSGKSLTIGPKPGVIGSVTTPDGHRVEIKPKVIISDVATVVAYAAGSTKATPDMTTLSDEGDLTQSVLREFVTEVRNVLFSGLAMRYNSRTQVGAAIRGRAVIPGNLSRSPQVTYRVFERTKRLPENAVLQYCLLKAIPLINDSPTRSKARGLLEQFDPTVISRRLDARSVRQIRLTRLTAHYRKALHLAEIILAGGGPSWNGGPHEGSALFIRTWELWERLIFQALRDIGISHVRTQSRLRHGFQKIDGTGPAGPALVPDIVIGTQYKPSVVLDAKWSDVVASRFGHDALVSAHLYQIASYMAALKVPGVLVYPRTNVSVDARYRLLGQDALITTIDLSVQPIQNLRSFALRLQAGLDSGTLMAPLPSSATGPLVKGPTPPPSVGAPRSLSASAETS